MRNKEKKKSSEDAQPPKEASENHQQSLQNQLIVNSSPLEPFQETVLLKKPLGLRISKNKLQVTYIEESGASVGRVCVGDIIIAIDGQKINTIHELNSVLRKSSSMAAVEFKRICYSKCKHKRTFVEKISVERGREMKCTGRAIDFEVNEYPIASKTMLDHFIQAAVIESGQINFTIESLAGGIDSYGDQVELANDVLEIAQKQIMQFRNLTSNTLDLPSILRKQQTSKTCRKIVISENFVELPIGADFDPSKLKPCKGANIEMGTIQKK